jgi:hypothetical protein
MGDCCEWVIDEDDDAWADLPCEEWLMGPPPPPCPPCWDGPWGEDDCPCPEDWFPEDP